MPIDLIREKILKVTVWACESFFENTFLGAVSIPLENIFPSHLLIDSVHNENIVCTHSNIQIEDWYHLTNV